MTKQELDEILLRHERLVEKVLEASNLNDEETVAFLLDEMDKIEENLKKEKKQARIKELGLRVL